MIKVEQTNRFKKEFELMLKRGKSSKKFKTFFDLLLDNINKNVPHHLLLPERYCLHRLSGKYNDSWECHIESDWLLVYYLDDDIIRL